MKALTLTQPWATLVAIGAKQIETRSWRTDFSGQLAIHAAKGFPAWAKATCDEPPFRDVLRAHRLGASDLPVGKILCVANLLTCIPTEDVPWDEALGDCPHEREFGDYAEGRWAWIFDGTLQTFYPPIAARGSLGLWNWRNK
jgi:hypothetical protein